MKGGEGGRGQAEADGAADDSEDEAFDQQLPDDPPAGGAEGGAHRDLAPALGRAREQQVGDVGAGDQQHEGDGAKNREERRPAGAADEAGLERLEPQAGHVLGLGLVGGDHLIRDRPQLGAGLRCGRAVAQTAEDAQHARGPGPLPFGGNERCPDLRRFGERLTAGHHADDRGRPAVDAKRAAEHAGIRAVARAPNSGADDDDGLRARALVGVDEIAAEGRRLPEHRERVGGEIRALHLFGQVTSVAEVHRRAAVAGEPGEMARLRPPLLQLDERRVAAAPVPQVPGEHVQVVGRFERKRPHERRVHDRETHRIGADAEGERQDRGGGEGAAADDQADGEAQVLHERIHHRQATRVAMLLAQRRRVAEPDAGGTLGVGRRQAAAQVVLDQQRQVAIELVGEVAIAGVGPEPRTHTSSELGQIRNHRRAPSSSTRPITPATRSQFAVSAASWRRPRREIA